MWEMRKSVSQCFGFCGEGVFFGSEGGIFAWMGWGKVVVGVSKELVGVVFIVCAAGFSLWVGVGGTEWKGGLLLFEHLCASVDGWMCSILNTVLSYTL
jgi:hypothetical protein